MTQVTINSVSGFTLPFSGVACNIYGNQCQSIGVISSLPTIITLPSQFDTASAVGIILIDSTGCERFETFLCSQPTPTPTPTNTATNTPTPTPTITESPTPTPTPTMTGALLNNYLATRCSITPGDAEIVNGNLLTGTTGTTFLGDDGYCYYTLYNVTGATTITPLLEFGNNSGGTSCDECFTGGCVNWEVTAGGSGADGTLLGCCNDIGINTFNLSPSQIITICSKTEPVVVTGSATIVNQGFCPGC